MSAAQAVRAIRSGERIFVGSNAAEPQTLVNVLAGAVHEILVTNLAAFAHEILVTNLAAFAHMSFTTRRTVTA